MLCTVRHCLLLPTFSRWLLWSGTSRFQDAKPSGPKNRLWPQHPVPEPKIPSLSLRHRREAKIPRSKPRTAGEPRIPGLSSGFQAPAATEPRIPQMKSRSPGPSLGHPPRA